ncbi:MAG TPA: phosphatase PAP2 family protein [Chryseosolibacter sp.]
MIREKLVLAVRWVRNFTREKFHSKNENLPYYVTILTSTIVFVLALYTFLELTDELAENELQGVDSAVTAFVLSLRSHELTIFFTFMTHLGDPYAYVIVTLLIAGFFLIKEVSWKFILQTVLVLGLATLSNVGLKRVIGRSRPTIEHLVSVDTLSYPSGHSMSAMAFYGFLVYLCLRLRISPWLRYVLTTILVVIILCIGASRVYLGVHFPSDVAAGFIGGLIWVAFCSIIFSLIDLWRMRAAIEKERLKGGGS